MDEGGLITEDAGDMYEDTPQKKIFWCCMLKIHRVFDTNGGQVPGGCEKLLGRDKELPMHLNDVDIQDIKTCCTLEKFPETTAFADGANCDEKAIKMMRCIRGKILTLMRENKWKKNNNNK
ncbi:hypothetical protein R5R35_014704 [Gryllus longicercus]